MMHWATQILEFKQFEEAGKLRLTIPVNKLFWKSGAVIDIAKNWFKIFCKNENFRQPTPPILANKYGLKICHKMRGRAA